MRLCQLGEVEGGLVSVGEADDHAGGAADGLQVGVEGGQEQVVGLFHAADGGLGNAAEREARVIIHGQLGDLRTRVCRHPGTSACPARTRSAPNRTGSRPVLMGPSLAFLPALFTVMLTASRARHKSPPRPACYPPAASTC